MSFSTRLKPWFKGWRLVGILVLLLIIGFVWFRIYQANHDTSNILTEIVHKQDLKQTVLATGEVTSSTDLNLSFKASGTVKQVYVQVGSKASPGKILAILDQKDQLASLTSARGSLTAAQANFDRVVSGASNEDVAVAQASVNSAKSALSTAQAQQSVLVSNAQSAMLNAGLAATPATSTTSTGTVSLSGTYNSTQTGQYNISLYLTGNGLSYSVTGLESINAIANRGIPLAVGTRGLFIILSSSGTFNTSDSWTVSIPNTQSSTYLTYANAYQAALQTQASAIGAAQSALDSATATLNLKKAQARPADLEAANAQILSAQGQVQSANAALENTIIRAPASGTVTKVDIKVGQTINSFAEAVVLQNIDQLHLEANVSEANVAQIKMGQSVDVTFDALGPDKHFQASVTNLDMASTVISGIVNYKLTASLEKNDGVLPGMTANMTILTDQKTGVIAIPQRAIIDNNGAKTVRVVTNSKSKTYRMQNIVMGITADGGLAEIISGLTEGEEIVSYINTK